MTEPTIPDAALTRAKRPSLAWIIPFLAFALASALVFDALKERGLPITIRFTDGHGIKPGDTIKHLGVNVGIVRDVRLDPDQTHVLIDANLDRSAAGLATDNTKFWIVRPEISLIRLSDVDTLLGPRYIALLPGEGPPKRKFEGVEIKPIESSSPKGLNLILETARAGAVKPGDPVFFRDMPVGKITDIEFSPHADAVHLIAEIRPEHAHLIRSNTKFWKAGGVEMDLGIGGLSVRADSLESVISAGVAFATPKKPGDPVQSGHTFDLAAEPDSNWLKWKPKLTPPPSQER